MQELVKLLEDVKKYFDNDYQNLCTIHKNIHDTSVVVLHKGQKDPGLNKIADELQKSIEKTIEERTEFLSCLYSLLLSIKMIQDLNEKVNKHTVN